MKSVSLPAHRAVLASFAALALGLSLAAEANPPKADLPTQLRPAANESLAMVVPAKGVQIYECRARKASASTRASASGRLFDVGYEWDFLSPANDRAAGYEWAFVAPDAVLFDQSGKTIGQHGAGPHWQAADGSRIVGKVVRRADAPTPSAIPWLLLATQSAGPDGSFSDITSIQRVNTVGGIAPANGCGPATAGTSVRIDYTADYHFYRSNP